jgi:hypothetical protein
MNLYNNNIPNVLWEHLAKFEMNLMSIEYGLKNTFKTM